MKLFAIIAAAGSIAAAVVAYNQIAAPGSAATPGKAPDFSLPAAAGKAVSLSQFQGKYVVLEWWNHQCPVVQKHYQGNIQGLHKQMKEKGVVWLSICSSAPGKQGHVSPDEGAEIMKKNGGEPTFVLVDSDGKVGKLYNARNTPQLVLISPKGELLYNGAIDNNPSASGSEIARSENYLLRAFGEHSSGKQVSTPMTRPYGCSVKY